MNDNRHDQEAAWVRSALDAELAGLSGRPEALQQILDRADSAQRHPRGYGGPALRPRMPRWAVAAVAVAAVAVAVAVAVPLVRSAHEELGQPSGRGGSPYPPASTPSGTPTHDPTSRRAVPAPATTPSVSPSGTGTTAHVPPRCDGPSLVVSVTGPEGAAGTIYRTVVFENTSSSACYLEGFPGVAATNDVDTIDARRDTSWPVSRVILQPRGTAHADIAIGSVPQLRGPCPVYPTLLVTPPDSRRTSSFSASMGICSSKVLLVRPVQPGPRT